MTTLHVGPEGEVAFAKGAPEVILDSCTHCWTPTGAAPLDQAGRETVLAAAHRMAGRALRVLGVASKPADRLDYAEHGMTWLGLVGMIDPPRPEAQASHPHVRAGRHQGRHDHGRPIPPPPRPSHGSSGC